MTAGIIDATAVRPRTAWWLPALVILIVTAIVHRETAPYVVGVFHDDGIYALLARSVATGQGFHYAHLPGAPAATHYPPLYPLLLAAVWRMAPGFPGNVPLMLGVNALLVGLSSAGCWWFVTACLGWPPRRGALASVAAGLTSPSIALAGALLSESLFLALLWPSLIASTKAIEKTGRAPILVAGGMIGTLMLVRTHAVALVAAVVVILAVRRRWRDTLILVAAVEALQLPWQLWSASARPRIPAPLEGAYGSYTGWFVNGLRGDGLDFLLATVRANAWECWLLLRDRATLGASEVTSIAALLLLIAVCAGAWSLRRRTPVTLAFVACYAGILVAWPYAPWRFVWGVWPLVLLVAFEGVRNLWINAGKGRLALVIGATLPSVAIARTELHAYAVKGWSEPARRAEAQIAPVVDWVRAHTAPSDVILAEGEQVVALYAGRRAAPPIAFTAREYLSPPSVNEGRMRLADMLVAVPARYAILLAPGLIASAEALVSSHPGLRRFGSVPGGAVFVVVP